MKYLRFGYIPEDEKSINFFSGKNENGVSVFEISNDNTPVLSNMRLISSMAARLDEKCFIVTGDIIGIGNDGEPLIKNVKVISEVKFDKQSRMDYIFLNINAVNKLVSKLGIPNRYQLVYHVVDKWYTEIRLD